MATPIIHLCPIRRKFHFKGSPTVREAFPALNIDMGAWSGLTGMTEYDGQPRQGPFCAAVAKLRRERSAVACQFIALGAVALAALVRIPVSAWLGDRVPFITFFPAVAITCMMCGAGPGLTATVAALVAASFVLPPAGTIRVDSVVDLFSLALFTCINLTFVVISRRMTRAVAATDRITAELAQSQAHLRMLIDGARDYAIFSMDLAGQITLWSPGAERLFGYTEAEALGQRVHILFTPEDVRYGAVEEELGKASSEGRAEDERWHLHKNGTRLFCSGFTRPMLNGEGLQVGYTKIARDMTDRRRTEEELRQYRERLEELVAARTDALQQSLDQLRRSERLASIGTMAAGVAHEINNPLNSILLTADYARRFPKEVESETAFDTIMNEARRCGRIVRGILKFAKDEKSVKEDSDLHEVVRRVAGIIGQYVPAENLWLDLDLAASLPPVTINATEIEQVLVNLIKNAVEASEDEVRVVIRTESDGEEVVVVVEDNGPGMSPETLRQIFDPFFSTHQHSGGTGLGLSICHSIITDHAGTITAYSRVGKGTSFTIRLPVKTKEPELPAAL